MRSRFVILPVLQPLEGDLPGIIEATAKRIDPEYAVEATEPKVRQAAEVFFQKGATPRHIRTALGNALLLRGNLDADAVLFAAHDLVESIDSGSVVYSDLWAIKACSSRSFLPWSRNPAQYPFPPHLEGIVDTATGEVDASELGKRLEALKPHANL